ncbi:MAG: HAMP domain-containing histidine kinase [Clostridia bacterium]|nr:HAMP domain-containing histidine kinase [Clostridia bacterium]
MRSDGHKAKNGLGIRAQLLLYLLVFMSMALLLLSLFQTLFLAEFYKQMKTNAVRSAVAAVTTALDTEDLESTMETWCNRESLSLYIVDADGTLLASMADDGKYVEDVSKIYMQSLYRQTQENGGELLQENANTKTEKRDPKENENLERGKPSDLPPDMTAPGEPTDGGEISVPKSPIPDEKKQPDGRPEEKWGEEPKNQMLLYSRIVHTASADRMVAAKALVTPVDATVTTLRLQFLIASAILILFTIVLALLLARRFAGPLEAINRSAKTLAGDRYESADAKGYREARELSATLDNTAIELKKSEQLQQELIANISHDLRTPLTMIIGYSEAIRDLPNEDSAENIQVVIDEAKRLTQLVNDLLDLSKMQSGTQQLLQDDVCLTDLVSDTVERCRRLTEQDGCSIVFDPQEECWVQGDALRLSQVVYNLLGNEITYAGDDKTVIVRQEKRGDRVRISFEDHGKGIPPEQLDQIWERYYQAGGGHRRATVGTGLGLSIVQSIVKLHGGECGVTSEIGKGSLFWFELPAME